jgi:D-alanyl-D-alanine carboxypeptidase/D-alanyl-D-alanine-endopeptidase (penicillin-binding protein 4)
MMKKNRAQNFSTQPLISLLLLCAVSYGSVVPLAAQETQQQRERRVSPVASPARPTPTPNASTDAATSKPAATPNNAAPARVPVASSTPLASTRLATRTIEELRARIQEVVHSEELAPAMFAVKVASLDTGRTLYEENAGKLLRPASNMKVFTISAALDRLTPDYRFTTSVYAAARPDAAGVLRGDMTVYGRGDPSISASFNNGDYYRAIDDLAARIAAAGVKRVEGDIVGDESYFNGAPVGMGWNWDDLTWYYGAEVSALSVNDNSLDLFVKPGATIGAQCVVTTGPVTPLVSIVNRTTTSPRGTKRDVSVYRSLGESVIEVGGSVPVEDATGYTGSIGLSHPALLFVYMLRSALVQHGVQITGKSRTMDARARNNVPLNTSALVEIANRQSPPLSQIATQTLKPSQNLYTELILRTLGKVAAQPAPANPNRTNEDAGIEVVKIFLREAGINGGLIITDGSGLSRNDMVTADATVQLLTYMNRHRDAQVLRDALPIAGVDGTLKSRLKGTAAANNLRAKTGSLSSAATLSGYVTSASGERLVFSIMANNFAEETDIRRSYIDVIAVLLASFAGHS